MAIRGRESEAVKVAAPPRPPFIPQVGRKYIQLINRQTGRLDLVLLDEWERMERGEGRQHFSPIACSICGGRIIKQCFMRDGGKTRWLETCPHLEGAMAGDR